VSLLTIIQGAYKRAGFGTTNDAFTSQDATVQQMVAFAQDIGDDLTERWWWKALKSTPPATFTGDGATTLFTLPADFGNLWPSEQFVSSSYPTRPLVGPMNEEVFLQLKLIGAGVAPSFWRMANATQIEFYPAPAIGETISYYYHSRNWIVDGGTGATKAEWGSNADTSRLPERLIMLGTLWKVKAAKGLDYAEDFRAYEMAFDRLAGSEHTERIIQMSISTGTQFGDSYVGQLTGPNVVDDLGQYLVTN